MIFPLFITVVVGQVSIPLSTPIASPAALPNAANLPQLCKDAQKYSSCSMEASTQIAACQPLALTDTSNNGTFYACVCTGMQNVLNCFSICPDDPQLAMQKPVYETQFTSQCSAYKQIAMANAKTTTATSTSSLVAIASVGPATDASSTTSSKASFPTLRPISIQQSSALTSSPFFFF